MFTLFRGFRLGTWFGVPIHVKFSFLVLLSLFLFTRGLAGVVLLLLTFASVLLHEFGHVLVAQRLGVHILGVDLHFFGGAAKMAELPKRPRDEVAIAIAGPLVSFALAGAFGLLHQVWNTSLVYQISVINFILGAFNLIPALPMDGGRVLRAFLAARKGRLRATEIAVTVAKVCAMLMIAYALYAGHFFLGALAVMLWMMSSAELAAVRIQETIGMNPFTQFSQFFEGNTAPPFQSPFQHPLHSANPFQGFHQPSPDVSDKEGEVTVLDKDGRPVSRHGTRPRTLPSSGIPRVIVIRW